MRELLWQKSSFSGDDANRDCVEIASELRGDSLLLRESDEPGTVLGPTRATLGALLDACKRARLLEPTPVPGAREPGHLTST